MKTIIETLPKKARMDLADLYEDPKYKSFTSLLDAIRLEIAKDCLILDKDKLEYVQGKAQALKDLHLTLRDNYKKMKAE